jgi:hypothetical protein
VYNTHGVFDSSFVSISSIVSHFEDKRDRTTMHSNARILEIKKIAKNMF